MKCSINVGHVCEVLKGFFRVCLQIRPYGRLGLDAHWRRTNSLKISARIGNLGSDARCAQPGIREAPVHCKRLLARSLICLSLPIVTLPLMGGFEFSRQKDLQLWCERVRTQPDFNGRVCSTFERSLFEPQTALCCAIDWGQEVDCGSGGMAGASAWYTRM